MEVVVIRYKCSHLTLMLFLYSTMVETEFKLCYSTDCSVTGREWSGTIDVVFSCWFVVSAFYTCNTTAISSALVSSIHKSTSEVWWRKHHKLVDHLLLDPNLSPSGSKEWIPKFIVSNVIISGWLSTSWNSVENGWCPIYTVNQETADSAINFSWDYLLSGVSFCNVNVPNPGTPSTT